MPFSSFGVVCFEVATQKEPFKGKRPAHVIGAVLYRGERPQIPAGASPLLDVVALMEQRWKQDPVKRPDEFGPVVRALASVVSRVGDPRAHTRAASDATWSSGATLLDDAPGDDPVTAPGTGSGGVDSSSSQSRPAFRPADSEATSGKNSDGPHFAAGGGRHIPDLEGEVSRRDASQAVVLGADNACAPIPDLPIATGGLPAMRERSGLPKSTVQTLGQKLSTRERHRDLVRLLFYIGRVLASHQIVLR